jgi:hypothetical protein
MALFSLTSPILSILIGLFVLAISLLPPASPQQDGLPPSEENVMDLLENIQTKMTDDNGFFKKLETDACERRGDIHSFAINYAKYKRLLESEDLKSKLNSSSGFQEGKSFLNMLTDLHGKLCDFTTLPQLACNGDNVCENCTDTMTSLKLKLSCKVIEHYSDTEEEVGGGGGGRSTSGPDRTPPTAAGKGPRLITPFGSNQIVSPFQLYTVTTTTLIAANCIFI